MGLNSDKVFYNLQCCRGIAAIIVLFGHSNVIQDPKLFSGFFIPGWCGVDFFFVLSGFIIYYINVRFVGKPSAFKQYISKRLLRVYPIYWLYTLMFLIIALAFYKYNGSYLIQWIGTNFIGITRSFTLYPTHVAIKQLPIIPVA